jgi:type IV pilus assembly protein PilY1
VLGITAKDGWFIALPTSAGPAERSVVNPTLIGGAVFFTTFIPSTDICVAAGNSNLYALYYRTGTAYTDPILGVDAAGASIRSISLGEGLASSVSIQVGAQPTGMSGFYQSSNSVTGKVSPKPPSVLWSQYLSWMSQRT